MKFFRFLSAAAVAALVCISLPASAQTVTVDDSDSAFGSRSGGGVVILMYHGLDPSAGANFNPASFVAQIDYLKTHGYQSVTLDDLKSWQTTGSPAMPAKPIVLTFDDNYLTIYTVGWPTLQAAGFKGFNFAHTNYVGVMTSYDHADWAEIRQMEASGVMLTESHTVMHLHLPTLSPTQIQNELVNSRTAIETNIPGKTCRYLAYPYGDYNAAVIAATTAAGYELAVTTMGGVNTRATPPLELRRYGVNPNTDGTTTLTPTFLNAVGAGLGTSWNSSAAGSGFEGAGYRTAPAGTGDRSATWTFTPSQTGTYRVKAKWAAGPDRATNAPYTVRHTAGTSVVRVNQQSTGGTWVTLGDYQLQAGVRVDVTLTDDANGVVVADAVQWQSLLAGVEAWELY